MKKNVHILIVLLFILSFFGTWQSAQASASTWRTLPASRDPMDASARAAWNNLAPDETMTVIVTLRQQANLARVGGVTRAARLQAVIRALQSTAKATQGPLAAFLNARLADGSVKHFDALWVFNGFSVTATGEAIAALSRQRDVFLITLDDVAIIPAAYATPEPNLSLVNAPALWNQGFTGQGIVVASMDSGVDVSHPDLATRWRGGTNSWFDPYNQHPTTPTDLSGHGTWTTGIMVGGDAGGTTVGVAPDAKWIAVKIFNDKGRSTATAIHQGFQWLLDPDGNPATADAPQVVNNSWTYGTPGCYLDFEPDLQSLRAAGILPVFAAGNGGPSSNTSYSPANNPSAFAVGAIDNNSQIYAYSSRGPTTCGSSTGPFPEVVAPGVNVRTTGLYGMYYTGSGTSFAAPHVAGGLALLLSAFPNLTADQQAQALTVSAFDLGASGPDDTFGYGRLDLSAAYQWLLTAPTATPTSQPTVAPTFTPTFTPIATATPTATQVLVTMHIGDLDASSVLSGGKWNATVTVWVHNSYEQPIANATVSVQWMNGASGTATCVTNSSGLCQVSKTGLASKIKSVTMSVTNVTLAGYTYQSSANHDPDGDSTGTIIVIAKP